jgi:WD40 repeat protein
MSELTEQERLALARAGGGDAFVSLLEDAIPGSESLALRGHAKRVDFVAFGADGRRIASGSLDASLRIWESGDRSLSTGDQ